MGANSATWKTANFLKVLNNNFFDFSHNIIFVANNIKTWRAK